MKKGFFLGLLFFGVAMLNAQRISDRKLLRQLHKIPQLNSAFTGVYVQQLGETNPTAQYNAKRYLTPASNTKLLTFLGAVETFSKLPALQYALTQDNKAHFKSTAYPLLLHPFYPDSTLLTFFKTHPSWVYHSANTAPKALGLGWSWDDYPFYYAAPSSVFPIYGNSVRVVQGSEGPLFTPFFPAVTDTLVQNVARERFANRFSYNPQKLNAQDTLYRPFIPNDSLFIKLLSKATNTEVIFAEEQIDSLTWKPLYTYQEETLYKGLLQDSDNGIAEALLLMIANEHQGVFLPEVAINSLQSRWASWLPDPLEWVDGSGVSRYNMVTPRTLVAVLQQIEKQLSWEQIQTLFPKSGTSGTLKAYGRLENVYAKTGTLRHNHNLSGYWTSPKGKRYAFAILVNHFTAPTSEIREGIMELINFLQKKLD